ncbi:hypothetical protein Tco_1004201 [Tanacetum coccineum]|uniref:Uncharacterized protein n=1 Tax=Tanacetum coccineum TaxID=301880 RepID=A0ABQ5FCI5_9ASTR
MEDPQSSYNPFNSVNAIKTCFESTNTLSKDQQQIKSLTIDKIETPKSKEPKKDLEDEFKDLHLNLPVLEVLAHTPMYNVIFDKYVASLELGKNGPAFIQSEMPKKMKDTELFILPCRLGYSEPFDIVADLRKVETLGRILSYRHRKDPTSPLLVGRGFLATTNAVIDCKNSKIAIGEGITRSIFRVREIGQENDFKDTYVHGEWEMVMDAELNPFRDELEDMIDKKKDCKKPPKEGDGAWHSRIELIDPDGERFDRVFQSIPATRKLSEKEKPSDILDLEHFYDA